MPHHPWTWHCSWKSCIVCVTYRLFTICAVSRINCSLLASDKTGDDYIVYNNNFVYLLQVKASADEVIKKQSKTTQPTLWCSLDEEGLLNQAFVVVDKAIFIEVSNVTYLNALLALMAVYFTFNLSYDKRQE